jgi:hypothetical protein
MMQVIDQVQDPLGRPALVFHERANDDLARHDHEVIVVRLPASFRELIGGTSETKGHQPKLSCFALMESRWGWLWRRLPNP